MSYNNKFLYILSGVALLIIGWVAYIWYHTSWKIGFTESIDSGLISGVGSFLGGLIGGVVAFGVARAQFLESQKKDEKTKQQKYLNLLKSLKSELKHNVSVIQTAMGLTEEHRKEYFALIESDIWKQVRFNANNFLSMKTFDLIEELYRDFRDVQSDFVEYRETKINYSLRMQVAESLIRKIEEKITELSNGEDTI